MVLRLLSVNGIFHADEETEVSKRPRKYCFIAHQQYFSLAVRDCRKSIVLTFVDVVSAIINSS